MYMYRLLFYMLYVHCTYIIYVYYSIYYILIIYRCHVVMCSCHVRAAHNEAPQSSCQGRPWPCLISCFPRSILSIRRSGGSCSECSVGELRVLSLADAADASATRVALCGTTSGECCARVPSLQFLFIVTFSSVTIILMGLEDYKDFVGTCAFVTTMGHMLTGTLICKDIYQKGTAKGCDPMPFIGGIGMCVLMLRYALILQDPAMININLFGIATNTAYMLMYYLYTPDKTDVMNKLGKAALFVAVILGYAHIESEEHIEYRYGILTTFLFLTLIASPLFNLGEIIRTKSTAMLPFPLIFVGTIVAFQWLVYGLIINNEFIIFQNAIGFTLSLAQLSLFAIYPSSPNDQEEKLKSDKKGK